ncbi:neurotransmitter-gated ion-channel ligand-binding protein [Peteryoungia desertarenae]|uniref:Neurotransmitter-gated ion-channel ligand-binding protein n=1 Tax=Peteryoungia desertarenae TaxID=1813451 RepID=A0ABX6QMY4_9HYPH|nr:neurotransmitter-gated ion-channel ligand-binding protein [Peteryoungia desertarenae]QLF69602.1 neurotransmitter-gated ion-channel ligand-binding protein [Peteryoungia desertarenae]
MTWHAFRLLLLLLAMVAAGARPLFAEEAAKPLPKGVYLPMAVHLTIRVLNVSRIDETAGEASMMIEVNERWSNPNLAFDPRITGFGRFDYIGAEAEQRLSGMWTPGTLIENQISEARTQSTAMIQRSDGTVTRITRLDADFRIKINMTTFPFDQQKLALSLISPRHSADEVIYVIDDIDRELSTVAIDVSATNWTPESMSVVMERFHGWNAQPFVRVVATAILTRDWQYYVLPIFVPFLAVLSVSVFILWSRDSLIGDKAPITYSALLALAALGFTYESSFPGSISMNSPVAFMVSLGYFYLILVLLIDIVLTYSNYPGRERYPHLEAEIRSNLRLSLPLVFILICLCAALRALA